MRRFSVHKPVGVQTGTIGRRGGAAPWDMGEGFYELMLDVNGSTPVDAPPPSYSTAHQLGELAEIYAGRDDEPIVGKAAYEFTADALQHPERYDFLAEAFSQIVQRRGRSQLILDLGSGPGVLTQEVALHLPDTQIVGVDISSDMVQLATGINARDNVRYLRSDARKAPEIAERPADGVISRRMLHRIEGLDVMIRRMVEAVRPSGGVVMLYCFRRPARDGELKAFLAAADNRGPYPALHEAFVKAVRNAPYLEDYIRVLQQVGRQLDVRRCRVRVYPFDVCVIIER